MKVLSPSRRRCCVEHMVAKIAVSERWARLVMGQHRATQRKIPEGRADEDVLTRALISRPFRFGRYRYGCIHWLLAQRDGKWA
ncbi:MAG: hypothetical protein NXI19_12585 [Alphaproteobacteria bacterium]|nr:hypothetical protein [Alphaproteobacteria bacterium]